jgi:hypothetical protein
MKQLEEAGIPMAKTVYFVRSDVEKMAEELPDEIGEGYYDEEVPGFAVYAALVEEAQEELGCYDVIMKPAQGSGGIGVRKWGRNKDFLDEFQANVWYQQDVVMFQCYQHQVATKGERGIIFVGGEVTHGLMKMPPKDKPGAYMVNTDFGGVWNVYQPTEEETAFAKQVASAVAQVVGVWPAYLRVDIFNDNDDKLALMELAAGTANLWLGHAPAAAEALAKYLDETLTNLENECSSYYSQNGISLETPGIDHAPACHNNIESKY